MIGQKKYVAILAVAAVMLVSTVLAAGGTQAFAHVDPVTQEVSCGSSHCEAEGCSCGETGCSAPDYAACGGSCSCGSQTCGA